MRFKKIVAWMLCTTMLTSMGINFNVVKAESKSNTSIEKEETENTSVENEVNISDSSKEESAEAEQEYRESAKIKKRRVVFSVIDYRKKGEKAQYLNEEAQLCKDNNLSKVNYIFEVKTDKVETKKGYTAYQVFYEATTSSSDVWKVVDTLNSLEAIYSAEPDFVWEETAQDDLVEVSSSEIAKETHFPNLEITDVWDGLKAESIKPGQGTVVAVIDTGVDYNHKDLANNIWTNKGEIPGNGIDDDGNGYVDDVHGIDLINNGNNPMDDHGHGTHVAGIIAMSPGNGGGVGIAYASQIMVIKAGQSNGTFASTDVARAIKYAADNGADVINMSFGGVGKSVLVEAALADAFSTCVLVAAAGNDGLPTTDAATAGYIAYEDIYPAGYDYVIGVMASDNNNQKASFSNWDFKTGLNCEYEMIAPGVGIYSTLPNNKYASWSGTSMAAPVVSAAAAIIRSHNTDKSKYSSRYIMGQLVSATKSTVSYTGELGDSHTYSRLNINQSLKYSPKPDLMIKDIVIFDGKDIDDNNNGDGVVQAGETIDIGFKVWNRCGVAKNVVVNADATSAGGVANPYIESITSKVSLEDIGTFAETDNGYVYDDSMLVGVTKPIRIKVKESAPNDAQIKMTLKVTAENGMDDRDKQIYNNDSYPATYNITVQKGQILHGKITEDMTLTADKYWIIDKSLLIPKGVTVTVEPGAQIQFWSADREDEYKDKQMVYLSVKGVFNCEGTAEKPINIFPDKSMDNYGVTINSKDGYASLKYTKVVNPTIAGGESLRSLPTSFINTIDHCYFLQDGPIMCRYMQNSSIEEEVCGGGIRSQAISNSIFDSIGAFQAFTGRYEPTDYCTVEADTVENCLFQNCSVFTNENVKFKKCTFIGKNNEQYMPEWEGYYKVADEGMSECAILNPLINKKREDWISIMPSGENDISLSNNYWGTENKELIGYQVKDSNSDVSLGKINQEPYLTKNSSAIKNIYPFVTDVYICDSDGNKITNISAGENAYIHVIFNRAMDTSVQPMVTYGGSAPYTDFAVYGNWKDNLEWVGKIKTSAVVDIGKMYPRIKGAISADDSWLTMGTDVGRFSFEINKNAVQSMTLQGSGSSGKNVLTWTQDDFDTLAGYNIYRAKSYDKNKNVSEQNFTKINDSIIADDSEENMTKYEDKDVEQGVDYYYYFTVVDTVFRESEPSNVVKCTPVDEEAPVIKHTPVVTGTKSESIYINAEVTDNVKVKSVKLYYKMDTAAEWNCIDMRNTTANNYRGVISSYNVSEGKMQYYITASDGTNEVNLSNGSSINEIEIKSEHNWNKGEVIKEATCLEKGKIKYVCSDCGEEKIEEIDALGHEYSSEWSVDKEASCTEVGSKSHHCKRCEAKNDVTEIPLKEHVYDGGKIIKSNSCTENGIRLLTCINCSSTLEQEIPAKSHNYIKKTYKADCTSRGYDLYTCSNCNETYKDNFTEAEGHNFVTKSQFEVSCDTDGLIVKECSKCGKIENTVISKKGHTFTTKKVEPTCLEKGYTLNICSKCGGTYKSDFVEAKGHTLVEKEKTEATCLEKGKIKYVCSDCGEEKIEEVDALGHEYSSEWSVDKESSCTEVGSKSHHCKRCEAKNDVTEIPLKEHVYDGGKIIKSNSCTENGIRLLTCINCSSTLEQEIPAKRHNYFKKTYKADCTSRGYDLYTCSNCNETYKDNFTEAEGHNFVTKSQFEVSCDTDGLIVKECSKCGKIENTVISKKGHTFTTKKVEPTCLEKGYTLNVCSKCGGTYKSDFVEAKGHTIVTDEKVEATCISTGLTEGSHCSECGEIIEPQKVTNVLGHNIVKDKEVSPTCTESGLTEGSHCSRCNTIILAQAVVSPLGHDMSMISDRDNLNHVWKCSRCDKTSVEQHKYNEWKMVTSPNCAKEGSAERTCEECAYKETKKISTTNNHTWDAGKITKAATEKEEGIIKYTCTTCGRTKTESIPRKEVSSKIKKGDKLTDDKKTGNYKVVDINKKEVSYQKPVRSNVKNIVIPNYVFIKGVRYKVTEIGANAFKGNKSITKITVGSNVRNIGKTAFSGTTKLKTIVIKSMSLTAKTVSQNAFKGIASKVTIKVSKKKLSTYKKIFKNKGLSSKIKVKVY